VEQTLAHDAARDWYYALMDLGVYFKRTMINPSRKSAHYIKQSTFKGSLRQMRGKIIGLLTQHTLLENDALMIHLEHDARIVPALDALVRDGLIMRTDRGFSIKN
jgi:A/G-specific adenine glycosylase